MDYHHIPSKKQIEKYGVESKDGISIGMNHDRHSVTRTYKGGNKPILKANENPRDSLARDVKDVKEIYQKNGMYSKEVKDSLKEIIKKNKETFPNLYKKP